MKQQSVSDLVSEAETGRVTVRAIAAETGLSIATVSRVLNGGENVAAQTRQRVSAVVERLPGPRPRAAPASADVGPGDPAARLRALPVPADRLLRAHCRVDRRDARAARAEHAPGRGR